MFAGDGDYLASTGKGTLTVKYATTLSVAGVSGTHGTSVTLSAALTIGTAGFSGQTVTFKVDGKSVGTAVTDTSGAASLPYATPATATVGSHMITVSFTGDATNLPASGGGTLTVS